MNEQTNINVEKLRPFTKLLMTIGTLPTSYLMSMTYLEQVTWFCNYLQNVVIPTINNNAQAVEELQDIINNLDLQDEVDTKLDEMAESGQLTDIIAQYLDLAGVLAFNNISEMASATNITNGSICYTLGQTTYNDGKGAFYKIRNVTTSDTIDGFNIVAITNDNTIIGERLPNYYINNLNSRVDLLEDCEIIINGDSYGNETGEWSYVLKNLLVANKDVSDASKVHIVCTSGSSAIKRDGTNFPTYLENLTNNESNIINKTKVKAIILCAGYNDNNKTTGELLTAFTTYYNYCKTTYPNANVYFGMIGWTKNNSEYSVRYNLIENVLRAYQNVGSFGGIYLNNVEYIMHNYKSGVWAEDGFHPSNAFGSTLGYKIYQAYKNGSVKDIQIDNQTITTGFFTNTFTIYEMTTTDHLEIGIIDTILGSPLNTYQLTNDYLQTIDFGVQNLNFVRRVNSIYTKIPVNLTLLGTSGGSNFRTTVPAFFTFSENGNLLLKFYHPFAVNTFPTITNAVIEARSSIDRLHV